MAFDEEDRENIEAIRNHLEKQGLRVSAAEAIRYVLRQAVGQIGNRCEGCGAVSTDLKADAGDNLLCRKCRKLK